MSGANIMPILIVIFRIGVGVVIVVVVVILLLLLLLTVVIPVFFLVGQTSHHECKKRQEDRHQTGHVPRQDERIPHVSEETHFDGL